MSDPRYPIGKFNKPEIITEEMIRNYIDTISAFPEKITNEVKLMSDNQLDTPYRDGGWTVRQLVNHCADSHMNAIIRFKLTLTETVPVVKPYLEAKWAELNDSKNIGIDAALKIIEGIHERWVALLKSMTKSDFEKTFFHPDQGKEIRLDVTLALYAWHSEHHLNHIIKLKENKNWN